MGVERSSNMFLGGDGDEGLVGRMGVLLVGGVDGRLSGRMGVLPFMVPRRFTRERASKISVSEWRENGSRFDRKVPEKRKGCWTGTG